jgi:hypothetical protein
VDLDLPGAFRAGGAMTDDRFPSDQGDSPDECDTDNDDGEDFVEAVFIGSRPRVSADRYDLEQLFLAWAWGAHYRDWKTAVRVLARALRGLSEAGLIERRTIRRRSGQTHHGFALTADGYEGLQALAGDWIRDRRSNGDDD